MANQFPFSALENKLQISAMYISGENGKLRVFTPSDFNSNITGDFTVSNIEVTSGNIFAEPTPTNSPNNFQISGTQGLVLSANENRNGYFIQNLATGRLFVKHGDSASASSFNYILAGGYSSDDGYGDSNYKRGYTGSLSVFTDQGTARFIAWQE